MKKRNRFHFLPDRSENPPPRWSLEAPHRKAIGFLLRERLSITSVRPISLPQNNPPRRRGDLRNCPSRPKGRFGEPATSSYR
jgi:hypothetical protein